MAAEVTVTLKKQGIMEECIKSMEGGSNAVRCVRLFERSHCKIPDGKFLSFSSST
jgi:hypothetical protein